MATKRKAIASSPFDELTAAPRQAKTHRGGPNEKPERDRATFHLPVELIEGLRNAVVALSGPPHRLTLAKLAESALRRELARLERESNEGKPFPRRSEGVRRGRPIAS